MLKKLGLVCLLIASAAQARMPERKPEVRATQVNPGPADAIIVFCGKNQTESLQSVIDANPGPVGILISGTCVESVLIRDKDISLRGRTNADGIRSDDPATPAL